MTSNDEALAPSGRGDRGSRVATHVATRLSLGFHRFQATAINDQGVVVGFAWGQSLNDYPFEWRYTAEPSFSQGVLEVLSGPAEKSVRSVRPNPPPKGVARQTDETRKRARKKFRTNTNPTQHLT